jgi:hypothetical protein
MISSAKNRIVIEAGVAGGGGITSLTGDVTATGPGAATATLANNAVTTAKINNGAVTEAKLGFTDNTTANVSSSAHGLFPKLAGLATQLMWMDGVQAAIPIGLFNTANPAGTTSATAVMMGLGGANSYTPTQSGRMMMFGFATLTNSVANDGINCGMRTGTGTAPANGVAVTGTQRGNTRTFTAPINGGIAFAVMIAVFTGSVGTPIWLDMAVTALTGGTATITQVSFLVIEL